MDRRIQRSRWTRKRILFLSLGALFVTLIIWGILSTLGGSRLNVDSDRLTISPVTFGGFQESTAVTGNVLPRTTVFLDVQEGGRIEQTFVLEGQQVEKDQPLFRLSNNDLQLRLLSADAARLEQVNRLEDIRFRMEQNALDLRQQLASMNYNILRLQRQHRRNEELLESRVLSQLEFEEVKDELDYWERTKLLTLQGYQQDSLRMETQLRQMEQAVQRMDANYHVLQQILDNLIFRAPISGHLTSFTPEIGQIVSPGANTGQIDVLDGYKVRAGIDEYYIARIQRDQTAMATIAGQEHSLVVTRVYPEVREGRFEADLEFVGEQPESIRRGQTIRMQLALSQSTEALLIPRGAFYQSTGGHWVYLVEGDIAERRTIQLGRQNLQVYEILDGLSEGDMVITSSYETFGDSDFLVLQ